MSWAVRETWAALAFAELLKNAPFVIHRVPLSLLLWETQGQITALLVHKIKRWWAVKACGVPKIRVPINELLLNKIRKNGNQKTRQNTRKIEGAMSSGNARNSSQGKGGT